MSRILVEKSEYGHKWKVSRVGRLTLHACFGKKLSNLIGSTVYLKNKRNDIHQSTTIIYSFDSPNASLSDADLDTCVLKVQKNTNKSSIASLTSDFRM